MGEEAPIRKTARRSPTAGHRSPTVRSTSWWRVESAGTTANPQAVLDATDVLFAEVKGALIPKRID